MLKALRWVLFAVVIYFFILPLLPAFRNAIGDLTRIDPVLLAVAIGLEFMALYCYSLLTHAALGQDANRLTRFDLFRIQLSTRALGSILPGGSAASNALGFRLITSSGISKADAGFALATAGIGSAVILNVLLWVGLVVSIPLRGSSPVYGTAAVAGAVLMAIVGAVVFGIVDDKGRLHRFVRWSYDKMGRDGESAASLLDHLRDRIRGLLAERDVLRRVVMWGTANWLLDLVALWLFLRAFGGSVSPDGLLVAFGLANVLASIPITPGGLGIVEGVYIPTLVGFGVPVATATVTVLTYRIAQFWLPIIVGGVSYASLRIGAVTPVPTPQSRLSRLQSAARAGSQVSESKARWIERNAPRDRTGMFETPRYEDTGELPEQPGDEPQQRPHDE
ncbi:MAG: lysylphosphatidylglycerol synthase transmembrane domain-containing protein [Ilumatobacteraceae bacterium]|nr:membrane protein [Actinomycetes bacterium]